MRAAILGPAGCSTLEEIHWTVIQTVFCFCFVFIVHRVFKFERKNIFFMHLGHGILYAISLVDLKHHKDC